MKQIALRNNDALERRGAWLELELRRSELHGRQKIGQRAGVQERNHHEARVAGVERRAPVVVVQIARLAFRVDDSLVLATDPMDRES
ncbi:MAG: hypothetical protein MUF54_05140 [Polyangiaceae bacterium]|nr:hypothetical protein [Polyangiaceae bacterium]